MKKMDKKRKTIEHKERTAKRFKMDSLARTELSTSSLLQDPATGTWNIIVPPPLPTNIVPLFSAVAYQRTYDHQLFLLRPLTSSKFPKVLVPIDPTQSLEEILRKRELLEFPTIYVFENPIEEVPEGFMLETDFLKATGQADGEISEISDTSSDEPSDDDTQSSENLEDGEIES